MAQDYNPDLSASFDALQRPMPAPEQPSGSIIGSVDGTTNHPEADELRHRPHAFALMHGEDGAKVAYGELHWRIDVLTFKFDTSTIAVSAHPDHAHEHDHTHTVSGTTSAAPASSGSESVTGAANPVNTSGDQDGGGGYYSTDDHVHPHAHTHTIPEHTHTFSATTSSPNESTTSGVKATDGSTASSATLNHTVTNQITYCKFVGQEAIGQINQRAPNYPAPDGSLMDSGINFNNNDKKYHELGAYGDVYLCWEADLEKGANSEVTNCWVQVGAPTNSDIGDLALGNGTTDRRDESPQDEPTEGLFSVKLGTVEEDAQVRQKISSDVVWSPTVVERFGP